VYVQSPAAGDWTVLVRGFNVPSGPQPFALIVDGVFAPPSPPSTPDGLFASASSATRVDLSWTDSTNEDRFDVERCALPGCNSFAKIGQTAANVLTYSDTTAAPSTTYSYRVQAVNTGGVSGYSNTATATTPAAPAAPQLHVADLDGSTATSKNTWTASVTITVRDGNSALVSGATVSGTWSGGLSGSASCNTAGGTCTVTTGTLSKSKTGATFTVTNITASGATYVPSSNGDPDGDSNGTTITVLKP